MCMKALSAHGPEREDPDTDPARVVRERRTLSLYAGGLDQNIYGATAP